RARRERNDEPRRRKSGEPRGKLQSVVIVGAGANLGNADDPAGTLEERRERALGALVAFDAWRIPARGLHEAARLVAQPQRAAGALNEVRERNDRALVQ